MHTRTTMCAGAMLAAGLLFIWHTPNAEAQGTRPVGAVTTSVTVTMSGKWERPVNFVARDAVTIQVTENCMYDIVDWSDENANLELVDCDTSVSAQGGGATQYPAPMKNLQWTYSGEQPSSPLSGVDLNPATGMGQFSLKGARVKTTVNTGETGEGALATLVIDALVTIAASGKVPEGVNLSGPRDFYELFRFKFPPKQKQFSGGNQGSYQISWTEGDGTQAQGTYSMSYTVSWGAREQKGELVFRPAPDYDIWLPAPLPERMPGIQVTPPATTLRVNVEILPAEKGKSPRKDKLYFSLRDVSKHSGRTWNYPREGLEKEDLRFAAEQPAGIVVDGPKEAHTTEEVSEAAVAIEALDTAASGRLTARAPVLGLRAKYLPLNTYSLTIPMDQDNNGIADHWEKGQGLNPGDDEETVPNQDGTGDSMAVEEEYRGYVVLEGKQKVFRRMDPKKKEIFVIDEGGVFDTALFEIASGIRVYRLDESMVRGGRDKLHTSRILRNNWQEGEPAKYAVRLETMPALIDPDQPTQTQPPMGYTLMEAGGPPREAELCKIFPAQIRAMVAGLYTWLGIALAQPNSKEGQKLAQSALPKFLAQRALEQLAPANREKLVQMMIKVTALHEVGHALGLEGHLNTQGKNQGKEGSEGDRTCLMRYPDDAALDELIILEALFGSNNGLPIQYSKFCRGSASGYECFRKLNVKD